MHSSSRPIAALLLSASLLAAGIAKAEELDMRKFHVLVHRNEVQAMARFGTGRETANVKVQVIDVATARDEQGRTFAYATAKYAHAPGGLRGITPTFLTTNLHCILPLDDAARVKRSGITTFSGTLFGVETENVHNDRTGSWDQIKHVIMSPCRTGESPGSTPPADAPGPDRAACTSYATSAAFRLGKAEQTAATDACVAQVGSMPRGTEERPVGAAELCEWFTYEVLRWDGEKAERATAACVEGP